MEVVDFNVIDMLREFPEILLVREVEDLLRVSRHKVYNMLKSGELRGFNDGKSHKIYRSSIITYLTEHKSFI